MLYITATDLISSLTFVAITTGRGSRKIHYSVMTATGRHGDNSIDARFVPLYFRKAAQAAN